MKESGDGEALHYGNPEDKQSVELQAKIKEQGVRKAAKEITHLTDEKLLDTIVAEYEKIRKAKRYLKSCLF